MSAEDRVAPRCLKCGDSMWSETDNHCTNCGTNQDEIAMSQDRVAQIRARLEKNRHTINFDEPPYGGSATDDIYWLLAELAAETLRADTAERELVRLSWSSPSVPPNSDLEDKRTFDETMTGWDG